MNVLNLFQQKIIKNQFVVVVEDIFLNIMKNVQLIANDINFLSVNKDERWSIQKNTRCENRQMAFWYY